MKNQPPDEPSPPTGDYWAWIAFGVMAMCMSLTFVFLKVSLEGFTFIQSTGGRVVIGASVLVPLAYVFGEGLPAKLWFWKWAGVIGLVNFVVPFSLMSYGLLALPSNLVGAMFSLIPLTTIALSALLLGVKISRRKLFGLCIGFIGLIVVTEPAKWMGSTGPKLALPIIATLLAIFCIAYAAILIRQMPKVHPFSLMGGSALVASVFGLLPFVTVFSGDIPPLRPWIGLLGVSIFSTTIALSIRFWLIRRKGPVFMAPNAYIGVVMANIFGVTILGDSITTAMMIALPLILLGLFIAQDSSGIMKQV